MNFDITEIVEGTTRFKIPIGAINEKVPPKEPASVSYTHLTLPTILLV